MLKLDVIEKVEGPTSWVNPLVVVEKPNGDIRICLDMRQANQAIVREKHPVPTVEETLQEVSYAKVFSKLDLNMAFHQIELHPDSRDITTFAAPDGLYRYKRLLFGVNMATEKSCNSQFEREALAVRRACERFYLYLHGIKFEICTDHKPLVTVLGAKSKPPSARIERWLLYLQQFQYTLTHIPGKVNVDVLSRLPVGLTQSEDTRETKDFAYSVASAVVPAALLPKQVEAAAANDPTLQRVRKAVMTGNWTQLSGAIYEAVKEELWVVRQVVMRGTRIVIP